MSDVKKDYEPFGDEWFLEMKKVNKTHLIEWLRAALMELKSIKETKTDSK